MKEWDDFGRMTQQGIYVHVPFCKRKCIYCDFYSVGLPEIPEKEYVEGIVRELQLRADEVRKADLYTLYIGGGTPSLLDPESIKRVIVTARDVIGSEFSEVTLEVNPDDVGYDKARAWSEAGVGRVSMGVQSLVDSELSTIGRRHDALQALEAFGTLRSFFDNISMDIIFSLPGQNIGTLETTIKGILEMNPEHISAYSLMYEERTALTALRDRGRLLPVDDMDCVEMFNFVSDKLKEADYERYELSNYCHPGYRSIHNSGYWRGTPYIGVGPAAHSYDGLRTRSFNPADLKRWIANFSSRSAGKIFSEKEYLEDNELREEMLLTRLRRAEGINVKEYARRFGKRECDIMMAKAERYLRDGKLIYDSDNLYLSEIGVMISDDIISDLF